MTRINAFRSMKEANLLTWGNDTSALIFAAVLIVCSVTVGCSSDKPKTVSSNNQTPVTQPGNPIQPMPEPTPVAQAAPKPAAKRVVHKKPATVNYADKTYGVTFEYPRRYAIETGEAATELLASTAIPMNFVQPGGLALAAVELPETSFANTDFSSAFFNVSVNQTLTADQCTEFAVPEPKPAMSASSTESTKTPAAAPAAETQSQTPATSQSASVKTESTASSRLILGNLELRATEAVSGEGTRQTDSKYFHVFQNGSCYEFALNVTTVASDQGVTKHVDRDKVFDRLEKILATVKINPVSAPEVTAEAPVSIPTVIPAQ